MTDLTPQGGSGPPSVHRPAFEPYPQVPRDQPAGRRFRKGVGWKATLLGGAPAREFPRRRRF